MARLAGVEKEPSLLARIAFRLARRRLGRVPRPLRLHALSSSLLLGFGQMERAQEKSRRLPESLTSLGQIRVAMRVGCPF